ncbi:MAG: hypothetical protein JWN74_1957 [Acidobacteriaceae bacterium]|nr:hypothetical protein [Acidobacteriaceae bacterium]
MSIAIAISELRRRVDAIASSQDVASCGLDFEAVLEDPGRGLLFSAGHF